MNPARFYFGLHGYLLALLITEMKRQGLGNHQSMDLAGLDWLYRNSIVH